jgi:hypothetical protein
MINRENGSIDVWMITAICLMVLSLALGGLSIWSYINYSDQKTNVDTKVNAAVATAKKVQADADEVKFTEREKQPNRQFVGPDDYGRLTFDYPKTWSVYVSGSTTSGGTYQAYLNPVSVPSVNTISQLFALRVNIAQQDYNKAVSSFDTLVKSGALKSSSVTVNGVTGVRLDGNFTKDLRGAEVMFKIRDKTLTVRTDANTFLPDFNALVQTIKFNQ